MTGGGVRPGFCPADQRDAEKAAAPSHTDGLSVWGSPFRR